MKNDDDKFLIKLDRASKEIKYLYDIIEQFDIPATIKNRTTLSLFELVLEHVAGIIILSRNGFFGSSLALVRVSFETYIRGLWLQRCASDQEIQFFLNYEKIKPIRLLIEDIEKLDGFKEGVLSRMKTNNWKQMCGFTHSGPIQIHHRNTETHIGANYCKSEILGVILSCLALAFLSANAICVAVKAEDTQVEILERMRIALDSNLES